MKSILLVAASVLVVVVFCCLPSATARGQSAGFRIPISLSDSLGTSYGPDTLWFGLHPVATNCVDTSLGEYFYFTECGLFGDHCAQFSPVTLSALHCTEFPLFLDLRRLWSSSQVDTFGVSAVGPSPIIVHWARNIRSLLDSCSLSYDTGRDYPPKRLYINMLDVDSAIIPFDDPYGLFLFKLRTVGPKGLTSASGPTAALPTVWNLSPNFPNPFNPETRIFYTIATVSQVWLVVYDVLGREVATLVRGYKQPGEYSVTWIADDMPGGVYFYRLQAEKFSQTRKLLLMR